MQVDKSSKMVDKNVMIEIDAHKIIIRIPQI